MDAITLLLADGHLLMRCGLCQALEQTRDLTVVCEAASVTEAVELARRYHPQVAIIDLILPEGGGIEACRRIVAQTSGVGVLILSTVDTDAYLARARAAGACGFVTKTSELSGLVNAVRRCADDRDGFTALQLRRISDWSRNVEGRLRQLTAREWDVLRLMVAGHTNAEMARDLVVTVKTVEYHVSQILSKLEMDSRREIIAWAHRVGLSGTTEVSIENFLLPDTRVFP